MQKAKKKAGRNRKGKGRVRDSLLNCRQRSTIDFMLTDKDIAKLKDVFPAKKEVRAIFQQELKETSSRFDRIETVVVSTEQHVVSLESRVDRIEKTLERLVQGVDRLVTEFQELRANMRP